MTLESILGVVRALIAAGAGMLLQAGLIDQSMVEMLIAAGVGIATAVWSIMSKLNPTQEFKKAIVKQVADDRARGLK